MAIEHPREKILCEVKYRNNSHIPASDAIVELCRDERAKVTSAFHVTRQLIKSACFFVGEENRQIFGEDKSRHMGQ